MWVVLGGVCGGGGGVGRRAVRAFGALTRLVVRHDRIGRKLFWCAVRAFGALARLVVVGHDRMAISSATFVALLTSSI